MGLGIATPRIKIMLQSNPPKTIMLARRLAVAVRTFFAVMSSVGDKGNEMGEHFRTNDDGSMKSMKVLYVGEDEIDR